MVNLILSRIIPDDLQTGVQTIRGGWALFAQIATGKFIAGKTVASKMKTSWGRLPF
jgi:hypothetical protein